MDFPPQVRTTLLAARNSLANDDVYSSCDFVLPQMGSNLSGRPEGGDIPYDEPLNCNDEICASMGRIVGSRPQPFSLRSSAGVLAGNDVAGMAGSQKIAAGKE
ncbi:hypothetical protein EPH_0035130 [Eimeria praecox]|uniref:Uncharacterized protein n=1 Tax=Eimeria praecox TaxID=51316 RepID=U6GL49_9EIME|nr:hypothetical protein EPH_0035130 [Eimeria praecox]